MHPHEHVDGFLQRITIGIVIIPVTAIIVTYGTFCPGWWFLHSSDNNRISTSIVFYPHSTINHSFLKHIKEIFEQGHIHPRPLINFLLPLHLLYFLCKRKLFIFRCLSNSNGGTAGVVRIRIEGEDVCDDSGELSCIELVSILKRILCFFNWATRPFFFFFFFF